MAYYPRSAVSIRHARGATEHYSWGDKRIRFVRCKTCGCVIHWEPIHGGTSSSRIGVNMRNLDPSVIEGVRVRRFDGAKTWRFLD